MKSKKTVLSYSDTPTKISGINLIKKVRAHFIEYVKKLWYRYTVEYFPVLGKKKKEGLALWYHVQLQPGKLASPMSAGLSPGSPFHIHLPVNQESSRRWLKLLSTCHPGEIPGWSSQASDVSLAQAWLCVTIWRLNQKLQMHAHTLFSLFFTLPCKYINKA